MDRLGVPPLPRPDILTQEKSGLLLHLTENSTNLAHSITELKLMQQYLINTILEQETPF